MENILFFPIWTGSPHFETDLELIMTEKRKGNRIFFLYCKNDFIICDNNLHGEKNTCKECIRVRKKALHIIGLKNITIIPLKKYKKNIISSIKYRSHINDFNNINELRKTNYKSFDIGYGIASSLANELDNSSFETWEKKIKDFIPEAMFFYECILSIIEEHLITSGYIFNGRFCFSRAFFRAFSEKSIPVYLHDRGSSYKQYSFFKNTLPHDITNYTQRINDFWDEENEIFFKKNVADVFFKNRYIGRETNYFSFTSEQDLHELPNKIDNYKKIVVIFNSSDFEYENIGNEYKHKMYSSQSDGIYQIVNSLKNDKNTGVFCREHPNLKNRNNNQRKELRTITAENFYLIPAESNINSYKLLFHADVVITFNSTMGVEATYWGIPSILCTTAIYENFNIAYKPSSHEEVIKLIRSDLKPIVSDDVYKYGYYCGLFGINYGYYKPSNLSNGLFMGIDLHINKYEKIKPFLKIKFPFLYKIFKYIKTKLFCRQIHTVHLI
jgi:hypothetical protein